MSDMVERVARGLIVLLGYPADVDWEATWIGNNIDTPDTGSLAYLCRSLARTAIEAMRLPTDTMLEAFWEAGDDCWGGTHAVVRQAVSAMIDQALSESKL